MNAISPVLIIPTRQRLRLVLTAWICFILLAPESGIRAQSSDQSGFKPAADISSLNSLPDIVLVNQLGNKVHFVSDLVKDHVFAINTIFTTCTTICLPLGANFAKLSNLLQAEDDTHGVQLISISVDPSTDTPERLRQWSARFGPSHNWTLLTGAKADVEQLLKALALFSPDINNHSPVVILGNGITGEWSRGDGLAHPEQMAAQLTRIARSTARTIAARKYFGDTLVVDQDGHELRFYSDLLMGKIVIINSFFSTCEQSCPRMAGTLAEIQKRLGTRLGTDVTIISITVDPEQETPAKLKAYADKLAAKPGWIFLTGTKANVSAVLHKLGQYVDDKQDHLSVFLIGNERTGLWKKAFGLSAVDDVMRVVQSVLDDKG
ncbi:MAG TPA: SCO family protein [Candidatus Angelobacter sp.]